MLRHLVCSLCFALPVSAHQVQSGVGFVHSPADELTVQLDGSDAKLDWFPAYTLYNTMRGQLQVYGLPTVGNPGSRASVDGAIGIRLLWKF